MAPPFFADLAKAATDILEDDYGLKKTFKVKHSTPHGVGFTVENEHKKGAISGKISAKYAYKPWGLNFDKVTLKPDGSVAVEGSLSGLTPGLKLTGKVDDSLKGDIGAEYTTSPLAGKLEVDLEVTTLKASATTAYQGIIAGGMLSYNLPGDKPQSVGDYNVGLSYGGKNYFASLTTGDMLKTFKVTASYSPMTDLTFAMLATANPEKTTQSLTVGTMYKCNPKTVMRTKVTSAGLISAAVSNQCAPKMTVTVGGEINAKDPSPKFGLTCQLG